MATTKVKPAKGVKKEKGNEAVLTISVGAEIREALLVVAEDHDRNLSSMCRVIFKEWMDSKGYSY